MQVFFRKIAILIVIFSTSSLFAQQDTTKNGIGTQKLIIVKPYSPTVSDAVKIKQTPSTDKQSDLFQRKPIKYDIFSVPVASTFTPEKGKATAVKSTQNPDAYNNYLAFGMGNYLNIFGEFYSNVETGEGQNLLIALNHQSSQGGTKKVLLKDEDKFYDTRFNLDYKAEEDDFYWGAGVEVLHQEYNWYGIFQNVFSEEQLNGINPAHTYIGAALKGNIDTKEGIFDKADFQYRHFRDDFKGSENHIVLKPNFKIPLGYDDFNAQVTFDYVGGQFKEMEKTKYSFLNLGLHPSYNYDLDEWALSLGAELFSSSDLENSEHKFYIHPKVKISYRLDEYLGLYAGVDGGVKQNTYYNFAQQNPFVMPQLFVHPTHTVYDAYAGAKGSLTDELEFDIAAGYKSEKDKALYHAYSSTFPEANRPYLYNNSFGITYDDVKTFYVRGGLTYSLDEDFNLGLSALIGSHSAKKEAKAWNLPESQFKLFADYHFTDQWSLGADLFYVGERKDFVVDYDMMETVKVKSYVDLNARINFQLNSHLGFFLRGNNLLNNNNQRFYQYYTQGIQGMIGASYQF